MVPASRPRSFLLLSTGLLALMLLSPAAQASTCPPTDCIPIVPFVRVPYLVGDVAFEGFAATVTVRDAVATTAIEVAVRNAGAQATEVQANLPLPDGAALLAFNLTVGERVLHGRVQESQAAQQQYNQAVEAGRDAALLRQADKRQVTLDLNVGPGESRVLRAAYAESVPLAGGSRVYRLPLSQLDPRPDAFHLDVDVSSRLGAEGLAASGVSVPFQGGRGSASALPAQAKDLLLTWREEAGARTSLVTAAPLGDGPTYGLATVCLDGLPVVARDVAFILDQSGSMSGLKIEEAREALVAGIGTITPADRFTVVPFSTEAVPFAAALVPGTASHVDAAQERAAQLGIEGGTNLDDALQEAFAQLAAGAPSSRLPMVVLLTDGLPTLGITDHEQIIQRAAAANTRHAPVIVVPIGLDADYTFLADLALRSGGAFVDPGSPDAVLSDRLARLAEVLARPMAVSPQLSFTGVDPSSVLPKALPPIYAEDCLEVRFRTDGSGPVGVQLAAVGAAGPVTESKTFGPGDAPVEPAVRNLWGQALVAELLSQERSAGGQALRAAIVANATEYGILSPYTSWVLADDAPSQPEPSSQEASAPQSGATRASTAALAATGTGAHSVGQPYGVAYDQSASGQPAGTGTGAASSAAGKENKTPGLGLAAVAAVLAAVALVARRRK